MPHLLGGGSLLPAHPSRDFTQTGHAISAVVQRAVRRCLGAGNDRHRPRPTSRSPFEMMRDVRRTCARPPSGTLFWLSRVEFACINTRRNLPVATHPWFILDRISKLHLLVTFFSQNHVVRISSFAAAGIVQRGRADLRCKLGWQCYDQLAVWCDGRGILAF